jgi:uncharacterized protein (UPF0332 family)
MTLGPEDKKTLSEVRIAKAYRLLEDADANCKDGRYETSVNRSYYAALTAVRAILILEGIDTESHKGAITMMSLRFVKPGLLSRDIVKKFELLLSRRTDVDYGDIEVIDSSDAEDSLRISREVLTEIDKARKELFKSLK